MAIVTLFLLSVSFRMTVAATPGTEWNPYVIRDIPSPNRYNYFDAELLEVLTHHGEGNVLVSPLAVKIALEMLMEGAVGRTAEEIRMALRLNKEDGSDRQEHPLRVSPLQAEGARGVVRFATKMFVTDRVRTNPQYQTTMKNLGSEMTAIRFQYPREAAEIINRWASNSTSGMISNLVDEGSIDPEAKLMLVNTVYFKGKWLRPFPKKNTHSMCFRTGNKCIEAAMMTDSGRYPFAYIPKLDADAISIPYEGKRFSLLVVLPKKNDIKQLSKDMLHVGLEEILSELREQEVHVRIPKFSMEYKGDLKMFLQNMNILQVFSPHAEMSGIFPGQRDAAVVNSVIFSGKMEVNEEGTEAAAAIGSLFVPLMGGSPTSFIADHPFLFFVLDKSSGVVLFSGKMERPEAVMASKGFSKSPNNYQPETVTKTIDSADSQNSYLPRGGRHPLTGRTITQEEYEMLQHQGGQWHPQYLQMSPERYHPTIEKKYKTHFGRTMSGQDAIFFGSQQTTNHRIENRQYPPEKNYATYQ